MKRVTHFRGIPIKDTGDDTTIRPPFDTPERAFELFDRDYQMFKRGLVLNPEFKVKVSGGTHRLLTEYLEAHPEANLPPIDTKEPVPVTVSALSRENRLLVRDLGDLAT